MKLFASALLAATSSALQLDSAWKAMAAADSHSLMAFAQTSAEYEANGESELSEDKMEPNADCCMFSTLSGYLLTNQHHQLYRGVSAQPQLTMTTMIKFFKYFKITLRNLSPLLKNLNVFFAFFGNPCLLVKNRRTLVVSDTSASTF